MSASDRKEEESETEKDQIDHFGVNDSYGEENEDRNSFEEKEGEFMRKKSKFCIFKCEEEDEEEDEEEKNSLEQLAKNSIKDKKRREQRDGKTRESYEESDNSTNFENTSNNKGKNLNNFFEESVSFDSNQAANRYYSEEESNFEVES